ncbi:hypothetical protein L1049_007605 [Liquidambar formosana]|uniref:Uncharacterized protein n=1 Tax=Liquidambar formosana TaxID=63359 RepID=A0AAP0X8J4_LIQFO
MNAMTAGQNQGKARKRSPSNQKSALRLTEVEMLGPAARASPYKNSSSACNDHNTDSM